MMFTLKPISKDAITRSLARAERYRLLNEPQEAESICRDVLRADPGNQEALVMLLLAVTDQFAPGSAVGIGDARTVLTELRGEYERLYYSGVISERWAKAQLKAGAPGSVAHDWFREAMTIYEKAEAIRPQGNEDAILRWNACARIIQRDERLEPRAREEGLEDDADGSPIP